MPVGEFEKRVRADACCHASLLVPLHKHIPAEELYFVLEGTGRMRVGDETLTFPRHEIPSCLLASINREASRQAVVRSTKVQRSREVEAIQVHHLGPRRDEVLHELLFRIRTSVNLRQGAELGV